MLSQAFVLGLILFVPVKEAPPDVAPYYRQFEEQYGLDKITIPVAITPLEKGTVAVCVDPLVGVRRIFIDEKDWYWGDERYRKTIVYHELGHCVFDLSHEHITEGLFEQRLLNSNSKTLIREDAVYSSIVPYRGSPSLLPSTTIPSGSRHRKDI